MGRRNTVSACACAGEEACAAASLFPAAAAVAACACMMLCQHMHMGGWPDALLPWWSCMGRCMTCSDSFTDSDQCDLQVSGRQKSRHMVAFGLRAGRHGSAVQLTAGSWTDEKETPDGVKAKGSWGEHEAGKDDAALPLDSLHMHSVCLSNNLAFIRITVSCPVPPSRLWGLEMRDIS